MDPEPQNEPKDKNGNLELQHQIFVGGCHPEMSEAKLREVFGVYGEIEQVRMKIDKLTGTVAPNPSNRQV